MPSDEVSQIKVGLHRTGIIGLKAVLDEVAEVSAARTDDEIRSELLKRLGERNYIPKSVENDYARAFLREYKKFVGATAEEEDTGLVEVKILGGGCPCCSQLDQDLMAVMAEMNLAADIEQVTDPNEIATYAVMGTPALVINREVKAVGAMPPKATIRELLREAVTKQPNS